MNLPSLLAKLFKLPTRAKGKRGSPLRSRELQLEVLEGRITPYAVTGNAWPHAELVTISFMPDGVDLGSVDSDLFSVFNGDHGSTTAWQSAILKGAQSWAAHTNLNFAVVSDNGAAWGAGDYQQGDPAMGDIRVLGANLGAGSLAWAMHAPPANNYSIAGDILFNTYYYFSLNGRTFDLSTVSMHEFGHALGMDHSTLSTTVMYGSYNGYDAGLSSDDINGIRSIYGGARQHDAHDAAASNGTLATATNINSAIDSVTLAGVVTGLDVTATSDVDFYKVTAPAGGTGQLTVTAQSSGLSLLAPNLRLYNAAGQLVANSSGSGNFGSTLSRTISVTAGQDYYIRVASANSSVFGIGAYALTVNFGTGSTPVVPLPDTQTENGDPISYGGGDALNRELVLSASRGPGHQHAEGLPTVFVPERRENPEVGRHTTAEGSVEDRQTTATEQSGASAAKFKNLLRRSASALAPLDSKDVTEFWVWVALKERDGRR